MSTDAPQAHMPQAEVELDEVAVAAVEAEAGPLPPDRFLDRELSWLAFNERVLQLSEDPDLPVLERAFPGSVPDVPHIDLRHVCAQAGLSGGLKRIERHLSIARAAAVRDVDGADAIMLWYRHQFGDEEALREKNEQHVYKYVRPRPRAQDNA
jgi:hypothetical protein